MNDDKRFVNRRGRQVLTKEVLGSIQLDNEPQETVTTTHVAKASKIRKQHARRIPRWLIATLFVLLLVLVAAPLLAGEYLRTEYLGSASHAKAKVQTLASSTVRAQQRDTKLTAAKMLPVISEVNLLRDSMCKGEFLDNLASLYPRAKTALEECFSMREKISALVRQLSVLQQEKAYVEDLKQILQPLGAVSGEPFANISVQQESWGTAAEQIKQLDPPTVMRSVHDKTLAAASATTGAWTSLVNANSAQDVAAFQAAEEELAAHYEDFRLLATEYQSVINKTQSSLSDAYKQLSN